MDIKLMQQIIIKKNMETRLVNTCLNIKIKKHTLFFYYTLEIYYIGKCQSNNKNENPFRQLLRCVLIRHHVSSIDLVNFSSQMANKIYFHYDIEIE